jgi:hypothetical protein
MHEAPTCARRRGPNCDAFHPEPLVSDTPLPLTQAQTGASGQDLYQTDEFRMFCFKVGPCIRGL